jgi:protein SCO1/2
MFKTLLPSSNSRTPRAIRAVLRALLVLGVGAGVGVGAGRWELGVARVSAQQQPGMPGSMGHQTGIVASNVPPQFKAVTFQQRLGETLPLDAALRDETGRDVVLGDYFDTRPVVLAFVYYQCPMLCNQVMNGISSALKAVPFTPGRDFDVLLVSFDPRDTPEAGNAKKQAHLAHWNVQDQADGWHFLTGDEATVRRIADAAGFTYQWEEKTGQFAHVSGLLALTPDGRLARYFYGVEYSPKDLRLALAESGQGRVGSVVEELLLYCYQYDPTTGRYGVVVMNLVRLGGVITVALIAGFVLVMRRRESRATVERHA